LLFPHLRHKPQLREKQPDIIGLPDDVVKISPDYIPVLSRCDFRISRAIDGSVIGLRDLAVFGSATTRPTPRMALI